MSVVRVVHAEVMRKYDKMNEEKHWRRRWWGLVLGSGFKYRTSLDLGSSSRG